MLCTNVWLANAFYLVMVPSSGRSFNNGTLGSEAAAGTRSVARPAVVNPSASRKTAANGTVTLITVNANGAVREESFRGWFFDPIAAGTARLGWTSDAGILNGDLEAVATRPGATMTAAEFSNDRWSIESKLGVDSKSKR